MTAWLRVPLTWYRSQTYSYYPDETHAAIRRTFTPVHAPHSQRNFCGFCGTPLTYWTESPPEEADYMSVTLGSLFSDDLRMLEDLELLPRDSTEDGSDRSPPAATDTTSESTPPATSSSSAVSSASPSFVKSYREGTTAGIPWFEEMIEGSKLGRIMRKRRGFGVSDDQSTTIEWEISEWHGSGSDTGRAMSESYSGTGKRKVDEMTDT